MTLTNAWDTAEDETQEWGDDGDQPPVWGESNDEPKAVSSAWDVGEDETTDTNWGSVDDEPAPTWGGTKQVPTWDSLVEDDDPGIDQPIAAPSTSWSLTRNPEPDEFEREEPVPPAPPLPAPALQPKPRRKFPIKLVAILAGAGLLVAVLGAVVIGMLNRAPEAAPDPQPTATEQTLRPELDQFTPFLQDLQAALNNRDPKAYRALLSAASQQVVDDKAAKVAIDSLGAGAQYEVVLVDGSVAGPTASLKLTLVQNKAGQKSEQPMIAELVKEGEVWKLVVKAKDQ